MSDSKSKIFYKEHGEALRRFFQKAQLSGYGNPETKVEQTEDGGSIIRFEDGEWLCIDRWYGGEPYSGITTIYLNGTPCWAMVYWGRVMPIPYKSHEPTLVCLAEALRRSDIQHPWRGPNKFTASNDLRYRNRWQGGIRRFSGEEFILSPKDTERPAWKRSTGDERLYEAYYRGGIINTD